MINDLNCISESANIVSPITGTFNTKICGYLDAQDIITGYKTSLNINVSKFFADETKIALVECNDTRVKFFHPAYLAGDASFYENLASLSWYYRDWKWEYEAAKNLLNKNDHVLEIGCGKGAFLDGVKGQVKDAIGLELNEDAVYYGETQGIRIKNRLIQDYARENPETIDVVCSFQVLEHIIDVKGFIHSSLEVLKPGGRMIVAVPNNRTLYFSNTTEVRLNYNLQQVTLLLNMPPHHMTLWDERSLRRLEKYFPIKVTKVLFEPLPEYRTELYSEIFIEKYLDGLSVKTKRKCRKIVDKLVNKLKNIIKGDSILIEYIKQDR